MSSDRLLVVAPMLVVSVPGVRGHIVGMPPPGRICTLTVPAPAVHAGHDADPKPGHCRRCGEPGGGRRPRRRMDAGSS